MTQQQICVCRSWISEVDGFRRIVKTPLGNMCTPSRFAFSLLSLKSKTVFSPLRNVGGEEWGGNWNNDEVRYSLHGLLIFLLFASYRLILTRFRSTQIAPSISYSVVPFSAPCRCLSWVTQESLIPRHPTCCLWCQATLRYSVYNNGYFKVAFFPSQEHDLSVFVLTYLLRHRQNGRMI